MIIELQEGLKKFPKYEKGDTFSYKDYVFSAELTKVKNKSLKATEILEVICDMMDANIELKKDWVKTAFKVYERDKDVFKSSFLTNCKDVGNISCYRMLNKPEVQQAIAEIEESLTDKFKEKFRGRAPRIVHSMAIASYIYKIPEQDIVDNFETNKVKNCLDKGVLAPAEVTVLMVCSKDVKGTGIFSVEAAKHAVKMYSSYLRTNNERDKIVGDWICNHSDTNEKILKKIAKRADELTINEDAPLEAVKSQLGALSSLSEVQKIEKQYKECGFKFSKCQFDLKFSDTIHNRYRMEILRPGDTRMVYLGEYTHCCQKLYDIGESAMMHGLLNPKAGFWCMTDERTGRVVAQAEIWEKEGDDNTLVFDNIEFANDADISLYREAIGKWLEESPYQNIYMGVGYNQMYHMGNFRSVEPLHPGVTPYEVYVISHEEESEAPVFKSEKKAREALEAGTVTYYDYVYCDSENRMVAMKENNVLEPYFTNEHVRELNDDRDEERELELLNSEESEYDNELDDELPFM